MPQRDRRLTERPKRVGGPERRKSMLEKRKRNLRKIRRDTIIVTFTLGMASIEIMFLGARPSALTFLGGLLISPVVLRYDEARKEASDD